MTTKVVIACPDNSIHNALVWVESKDTDGNWTRGADPVVIPPRTTAAPLYLTSAMRVVIEEESRAQAEPR